MNGQTHQRGANLHEFADLLVRRGVVNAINLDGGGSSTFVKDQILINYPTDHWYVERERERERWLSMCELFVFLFAVLVLQRIGVRGPFRRSCVCTMFSALSRSAAAMGHVTWARVSVILRGLERGAVSSTAVLLSATTMPLVTMVPNK